MTGGVGRIALLAACVATGVLPGTVVGQETNPTHADPVVRRSPTGRPTSFLQDSLRLGGPIPLEGVLLRGEEPMPGGLVVLHRVGAVDAGPVDSVRTGADGRFSLTLPRLPDPETGEIYFASNRHQGLLYFGAAITGAPSLDSTYTIQAFDTLRAPAAGAPLEVEVRYLLVEASERGWGITDLVQPRLDGVNTLVPEPEGATWATTLPLEARDPRVVGGDFPPEATTFGPGRAAVAMPISPGSRQFVMGYEVESLDFDLELPGSTSEVEVLVPESAPPLQIAGLTPAEPIETPEGITYRRYLGVALTDAALEFREGEGPGQLPVRELGVLLALLLAGLGVWVVRRGQDGGPVGAGAGGTRTHLPAEASAPAPAAPSSTAASTADPAAPPPTSPRERILFAIARLDEELEGADAVRTERIRGERAQLMERLRELP